MAVAFNDNDFNDNYLMFIFHSPFFLSLFGCETVNDIPFWLLLLEAETSIHQRAGGNAHSAIEKLYKIREKYRETQLLPSQASPPSPLSSAPTSPLASSDNGRSAATSGTAGSYSDPEARLSASDTMPLSGDAAKLSSGEGVEERKMSVVEEQNLNDVIFRAKRRERDTLLAISSAHLQLGEPHLAIAILEEMLQLQVIITCGK